MVSLDLSDYYTKAEVDALIVSGGGTQIDYNLLNKAQLKPSGQRFYEVKWSVNSMLENSDHRKSGKSRKSLSIQYLNLN